MTEVTGTPQHQNSENPNSQPVDGATLPREYGTSLDNRYLGNMDLLLQDLREGKISPEDFAQIYELNAQYTAEHKTNTEGQDESTPDTATDTPDALKVADGSEVAPETYDADHGILAKIRRHKGRTALVMASAVAALVTTGLAVGGTKGSSNDKVAAKPVPAATATGYVPSPTTVPTEETSQPPFATSTPEASQSPEIKTDDSLIDTLTSVSPEDFADFPRDKQLKYVVYQYWRMSAKADFYDWVSYSLPDDEKESPSDPLHLFDYNPLDVAAASNSAQMIAKQEIFARQMTLALAESDLGSSKFNDGEKMLAGVLWNPNEDDNSKSYNGMKDDLHDAYKRRDGSAHTAAVDIENPDSIYKGKEESGLTSGEDDKGNPIQYRDVITTGHLRIGEKRESITRQNRYILTPYKVVLTDPATQEPVKLEGNLWLLDSSKIVG